MGWYNSATRDGTASDPSPVGNIDTRMWIAAGAAAGNIAMTGSGITTDDLLIQVVTMDLDTVATTGGADDPLKVGAGGLEDLTSEFTISADDQINNTGGTTSANEIVFVIWADRSAGLPTGAGS